MHRPPLCNPKGWADLLGKKKNMYRAGAGVHFTTIQQTQNTDDAMHSRDKIQ